MLVYVLSMFGGGWKIKVSTISLFAYLFGHHFNYVLMSLLKRQKELSNKNQNKLNLLRNMETSKEIEG